jgi:hypothetical protein
MTGPDGDGAIVALSPGEDDPPGVTVGEGSWLALPVALGVGLTLGAQAVSSRMTATPAARRRMDIAVNWGGSGGRRG